MSQTAACVSCPARLYWALRNQRRGPLLRRDIAASCARSCGVSCNPCPPCVRSQAVPSSPLAVIHWLSSNRLGMRAQPLCPSAAAHPPRFGPVGAMLAGRDGAYRRWLHAPPRTPAGPPKVFGGGGGAKGHPAGRARLWGVFSPPG